LPLSVTADPTFYEKLGACLGRLDYSGQYTDIPAGFESALYELRERGRSGVSKAIVLVTDGVVDLPDRSQIAERKKWLQESLLREAKELGIRAFGIAFTRDADLQLIQSLATETDGAYWRVDTSASFDEGFAGIFDAAQGRIKVPSAPAPENLAHSGEPKSAMPGSIPSRLLFWLIVAVVAFGVLVILAGKYAIHVSGGRSGGAIPEKDRALLREVTKPEYTIVLERRLTIFGREQNSDVPLRDPTVSQPHAAIEFRNGIFYLRDMRSANGTFLDSAQYPNPRRLDPSREEALKHGDIIRFGRLNAFNFETVAGGLTVVEGGTAIIPTSCYFHAERPPFTVCSDCRVALCSDCFQTHECSGKAQQV